LQLQEATLVLAKQTKPDGRGLPPTKLLAVCLCSPEQMRRYRDVEREGGREKRERERRERERKQNDVNTSPNERNTRTRLNSPTGRFSNRGVQLGGIDVEPTHRRLLVRFHFLGDLHAKQFAELVSAALLQDLNVLPFLQYVSNDVHMANSSTEFMQVQVQKKRKKENTYRKRTPQNQP
jgi:hypothetical protein